MAELIRLHAPACNYERCPRVASRLLLRGDKTRVGEFCWDHGHEELIRLMAEEAAAATMEKLVP